MKIEYLEIKNYKQFTDLTLDLTYPKGHEKEGEPLDKICIIGQSGTGKTNLLHLIMNSTIHHLSSRFFFTSKKSYIKIKYKIKNKNSIEEFKSTDTEKVELTKIKQEQEQGYLIDVSKEEIHEIWSILKSKIDNYATKRLEYVNQLSNKLLSIDNYEKKNFKRDIKDWENKNNNILEQISDKLNEILIRFNLQLTKIDKNELSYTKLNFKDLSSNKTIEYRNVSTGTKNLLSTFIPLKSYNPKDSIILIDEPENSFYPDIQRELTDLYMNVGENNQLIMATHSPLIASSFEPWEVVELKFDKNNQIYREKYYEGENHIDNYTLDPRMLTWTSILVDIFDLTEDSFSLREKKLMEYGMLKAEIKAMNKGEDRDAKIKKFKKLSALLGLQN